MKKSILLLILISVSLYVSPQSTAGLIEPDKIWSVLNITYQYENGTGSVFYKFSGDTTIENLNYYKVYQSYDSTKESWLSTGAFVREDSGKVYKRDDRNIDILMYDFNLNLKDTIVLDNMFDQSSSWVVDSVDSVYVRDKYRKRIFLQVPDCSGCPVDIWISGIGSLLGILTPGNTPIDFSTELLCVEDMDGYLYTNPNYQSCYYSYVGINHVLIPDEIQIYPTVVYKSITISTSAKLYELMIYKATGGLVLQRMYFGNSEIDCSELNPGLYLVRTKIGNYIITKKFVKI